MSNKDGQLELPSKPRTKKQAKKQRRKRKRSEAKDVYGEVSPLYNKFHGYH